MTAVLAPRARRDLLAAVRWIANDNPAAARALRDAVARAAENIMAHPMIGPHHPELASPPYRFLSLTGFPILSSIHQRRILRSSCVFYMPREIYRTFCEKGDDILLAHLHRELRKNLRHCRGQVFGDQAAAHDNAAYAMAPDCGAGGLKCGHALGEQSQHKARQAKPPPGPAAYTNSGIYGPLSVEWKSPLIWSERDANMEFTPGDRVRFRTDSLLGHGQQRSGQIGTVMQVLDLPTSEGPRVDIKFVFGVERGIRVSEIEHAN